MADSFADWVEMEKYAVRMSEASWFLVLKEKPGTPEFSEKSRVARLWDTRADRMRAKMADHFTRGSYDVKT